MNKQKSKDKVSWRINPALFVLGFCFLFDYSVLAQTSTPVATIVSVVGQVETSRQNSGIWLPAQPEQPLYLGDAVRTGANGRVDLLSADETLISLTRHTTLIFEQVAPIAGWLPTSATVVNFFRSIYELCSGKNNEQGEASFINKNKNINIDVDTPLVRASVRGTAFTLKVKSQENCSAHPGDSSILTMLEGQVTAINAQNAQDQLLAVPGDQVIAEFGQPLRLERLQITPEDAVQWALLIPPLFEQKDIARLQNQALTQLLQNAYDNLRNSQITVARDQLLELVKQYPKQPAPWRLLSLSHLVLNQKQQALNTALQSTAKAPDSAAAWMTLSYAYQAGFDLNQAEIAVSKALDLEPNNILGLVNLSRLQFGRDDIETAWRTMQTAKPLAPNDAEVENLRGFLLLARQESDLAIAAFQNAIRLNRQLGEPHLGLGLVYMRQGEEGKALQEIATAVLLEPNRSLFMSYWAKMLYQLKRFDKALDMLTLAKRYDPQDPTPYLYESLILRDLNRTTDAIQSLNEAIVLNDRRAIYRSRFLLDRDLAVKNANLSELYEQLGLNAWAKSKATNSIKDDYFNASAHSFLAGVLGEKEDRAWPQASEALLGRLLYSGSINSFNTYNDYTALLEQPGISGTFSIATGNHDYIDHQWLLYGALPDQHLAFGLSATYFDDSGWRNTDEEQFEDITGIVKWDLTPSDNMLFSASYARQRYDGERFPRFEFDSPADPEEFVDAQFAQLELGYHHDFGSASDLLLYFSWQDFDSGQSEHTTRSLVDGRSLKSFINTDSDSISYQIQGQYVVATQHHQLILGTLHYWIDNRSKILLDGFLLDGEDEIPAVQPDLRHRYSDTHFQSYYIQDIWTLSPTLSLESAVYFEKFKTNGTISAGDPQNSVSKTDTQEELNARLGLVWKATEQDTFRVAAFQYLLPRISSRLDPMDVAGVTIFRNGLEGSLAEEMDLIWEHEWKTGFFSATAFHQTIEFSIGDRSEQGRQKGVELELNQLLPWAYMGLAAQYRYLDIENDALYGFITDSRFAFFRDDPILVDRQEHQFTLDLNYLNPNGLYAGLTQTYRNINSIAEDRPDEDIWVTDFRIGYEFPDKKGAFDLEIRNVFDQKFNWVLDPFSTGGLLSAPRPSREIFATFSLNF